MFDNVGAHPGENESKICEDSKKTKLDWESS